MQALWLKMLGIERSDLSKRARAILYAVVTEFIQAGEPVGSRTLAKKYRLDLSPATIRNELADLEDAGYLAQPHTSAGRVPTELAFRLFIDALMRVRQLSAEDAERISEFFGDARRGSEFMRDAGRLLSDLSGAAALVLRSRNETRTLMRIRFIPTRPGELLAVLVTSDGVVENRFIAVGETPSSSTLERLHNMLEEVAEGRTIREVRDLFVQRAKRDRSELAALRELGQSLMAAALDGAKGRADVVIEGSARLLDRPEFASAERVKELLTALEDHERLVNLLDDTLASEHVQVYLGDQTSELVGVPVSLIVAPYHEDGRPGGALGVLGPTRMDYPGVVPLVGAAASAMTAALAREDGGRADGGSSDER